MSGVNNPRQQRKHPCYQCEDRHIGCHSECDAYKQWCEKNEKMKKDIFEQKQLDIAIVESHINRRMRMGGKKMTYREFRKREKK